MTEAMATIGDNKGPTIDTYRELNDQLLPYLEIEEVALIKRYDEIKAAYARVPAVVDSDELDAKITDFAAKQFGSVRAALNAAHENYKRPFIDGGKTVDGVFKRRSDEAEAMVKDLRRRQTTWKLAKETAERKRLEDEARARREAEDKARKEAEAAAQALQDANSLDDAVALEEAADRAEAARIAAEQAAAAKPADLTRARGDHGGVSSLRKEWKARRDPEVAIAGVDWTALGPYFTAEAVEQAARGWVKANCPKDTSQPAPKLKGFEVYVHATTR